MGTSAAVPGPAIADAVRHAVTDLGVVRTGIAQGMASDRELLDAVESLAALQRQVSGTLSVAMAAAEARNSAMRTLGTPLEAVLTRSGQESARQVRNQVFQAGILAKTPRVHEAAATGRITLGQAQAIREVVDGLPSTLDEVQTQCAEELLLTAADRLPTDVLRTMTDTVLDQVAPDAKDTPQQRQAKLDARDARARQRRSLRFSSPVDGSIDIHGSLPIVDGTRLKNLVEGIAARDYRTAKDTADRPRLAAGQLRRLLCDAELIPVVFGGGSEILDLGRGRRLASAAQRHALALRDGHRAFPGCSVPMLRCELHHIKPWQDGGPTDLDNLVALCVRHHQLCEPAPPITDENRYARPPDQWTIRARKGRGPGFVPPSALTTAHPHALATDPPPRIHALTLFEDATGSMMTESAGRRRV